MSVSRFNMDPILAVLRATSLIDGCRLRYMSKAETMEQLRTQHNVDPEITRASRAIWADQERIARALALSAQNRRLYELYEQELTHMQEMERGCLALSAEISRSSQLLQEESTHLIGGGTAHHNFAAQLPNSPPSPAAAASDVASHEANP